MAMAGLCACKCNKTAQSQAVIPSAPLLWKNAYEEMGIQLMCETSTDSTYLLCKQKDDGHPAVTYTVLDQSTGQVVIPKSFFLGEINWHDDSTLKMWKYIGRMEDADQPDVVSYMKVSGKDRQAPTDF